MKDELSGLTVPLFCMDILGFSLPTCFEIRYVIGRIMFFPSLFMHFNAPDGSKNGKWIQNGFNMFFPWTLHFVNIFYCNTETSIPEDICRQTECVNNFYE
jgi:hypothetical protein